MAPIAPPARRVELGDQLVPSSLIGYQVVILNSSEIVAWASDLEQRQSRARGKIAARGMRLRALFSHPFRGGLTSAAPTALGRGRGQICRRDAGDTKGDGEKNAVAL